MAPVAAAKAAPPDRDLIPGEIPRDRWKRPLIEQPDGTRIGYTRASTLGKALEDDTNITRWKLRMAAWGLARHRDQILAAASVATTTEAGDKARLDAIVDTVMDRAGAGAKATVGTALHAFGERIDRGEEVPDIGEDRWALQAYAAVMREHFEVVASETFVVCDALQAAGTFDRLVRLRHDMVAPDGTVLPAGTLVVLDVKTSGTSDYFGISFAVQLWVYAGGELYDPATGQRATLGAHDRWALILHVPSGGNTAELHWVDLARGRELAELAVRVRAERKARGLIVPAVLDAPVPAGSLVPTVGAVARAFAVPGETPPGGLGPSLQQDAARTRLLVSIGCVRSEDEAAQLWRSHSQVWTDEHTEAVTRRLAELAGRPA